MYTNSAPSSIVTTINAFIVKYVRHLHANRSDAISSAGSPHLSTPYEKSITNTQLNARAGFVSVKNELYPVPTTLSRTRLFFRQNRNSTISISFPRKPIS